MNAEPFTRAPFTNRQLDTFNGIEIRIRNIATMSRMLAEAPDQDWEDAVRVFYEMSYTLDRLADQMQDATHPTVAAGEGRA